MPQQLSYEEFRRLAKAGKSDEELVSLMGRSVSRRAGESQTPTARFMRAGVSETGEMWEKFKEALGGLFQSAPPPRNWREGLQAGLEQTLAVPRAGLGAARALIEEPAAAAGLASTGTAEGLGMAVPHALLAALQALPITPAPIRGALRHPIRTMRGIPGKVAEAPVAASAQEGLIQDLLGSRSTTIPRAGSELGQWRRLEFGEESPFTTPKMVALADDPDIARILESFQSRSSALPRAKPGASPLKMQGPSNYPDIVRMLEAFQRRTKTWP